MKCQVKRSDNSECNKKVDGKCKYCNKHFCVPNVLRLLQERHMFSLNSIVINIFLKRTNKVSYLKQIRGARLDA